MDGSNGASAVGVSTESAESASPALVQVSGNTVQVQGVIQTAVGQTLIPVSVASEADVAEEDERKRRELLTRRPSYRKIFNDLSGTDQAASVIAVQTKVETEDSNDSHTSGAEDSEPNYSAGASVTVVPASALQLANESGSLQTLTMTNDSVKGATAQTATIVQYAQEPATGQFFIPVSAISTGNVQYQIASNSLPQGVVMATGGSSMGSPTHVPEEASRKRELRLMKNREAARECRRKKKEYVKCLENRVAVLENQNKTLIEELKSLKELYCQKEAQS